MKALDVKRLVWSAATIVMIIRELNDMQIINAKEIADGIKDTVKCGFECVKGCFN